MDGKDLLSMDIRYKVIHIDMALEVVSLILRQTKIKAG